MAFPQDGGIPGAPSFQGTWRNRCSRLVAALEDGQAEGQTAGRYRPGIQTKMADMPFRLSNGMYHQAAVAHRGVCVRSGSGEKSGRSEL
jgi:hypothetical protein